MKSIELLVPAKDLETGLAAINCGADAIYIGGPQFGAREAASNPLQDIERLANYAHKYWAKIYITINTILYDKELDEAEKLILQLYNAGADGLIIQDVGLLELNLPPIPLIASTQMHNQSPERIAFLEQVGFKRAILARELTLDQIYQIHSRTNIELETFIHGELCVSYSGQCYLSYAIGGRSGNRGQCAQPCRRKYSLIGAENKSIVQNRYLLSLRDLNLSESLNDLMDAGVSSFKIEGRLKDKTYVMNIVGYYRQKLDVILNKRSMKPASSGSIHFDFTPNPYKTFNRGYSTYFLYGRNQKLASFQTLKSLGEPLGKVISHNERSFTLELSAPQVFPGDGLCFLNADHKLVGSIVNQVNNRLIFPRNMAGFLPGVQVYRNHDHEFNELLRKSHTDRRIKMHFQLSKISETFHIIAVDEDNNRVDLSIDGKLETAKNTEKARQTIEHQLCKLGGTEFECSQVDFDFLEAPFLTVARLNSFRREIIEKLILARQHNRPVETSAIVHNNIAQFPEKRLLYNGNVLNSRAAEFYYRHGVKTIEPAAESGLEMNGRKVMTTKYCLRFELNVCPYQTKSQKLAEPLELIDEQGVHYPLRFNCTDCVMEVYYRSLPAKFLDP
ncbi:MAG TPA: U32 family peptidase [Anaerolineaceae bacterium]|nr:U32 family peptidase [Anaerolineaceae bacterium]